MATQKIKFATIDIHVNDNITRSGLWYIQAKSLVTMNDDDFEDYGTMESRETEEAAMRFANAWAEAISSNDTEQVVIFKNGSEVKHLKK